MHVCQTILAPLEFERQTFVVDTELIEDCRLKVVGVDAVFDRIEAEVVTLSVCDSRLDSATCHPRRECVRVMIAAPLAAFIDVALNERRPAKLAAPHDQGVL